MATQKIRTHHETLTRENEKLVRQLHQRDRQQQGQTSGKHAYIVEEDYPVQHVNPFLFNFINSSLVRISLGKSTC